MRSLVAFLSVPVALLIAISPAHAYSGSLSPSGRIGSYTAYYDGAYGPYYNGYWTASNDYYFTAGPGRPYVRDDQGHFRRVMIPGFHPVEGSGPNVDPGPGVATSDR